MKAYLMTRGTARKLDYAFLDAAPPTQWWQPVATWVVLEEPETIVCRHGESLGLLLTGIPSARRDVIGTAIRYRLVVDDLQDEPAVARRLVACGLTAEARGELGRRLDEIFDVATVDAILRGADRGDAVEESLLKLLRSGGWPDPGDAPQQDIAGQWAGPAESPPAREAFIGRVEQLLQGHAGFAFTSHSLTTLAGASQAVASVGGSVAILLHDSALTGVEHLGKDPSPRPGLRPRPDRRGLTVVIVIALALGGTALILIWWLIRRT